MLVTCYLDPSHGFRHLSLILAGSIELAAVERIQLQFAPGRIGRAVPPMECVLEFDLQLADGRTIRGAFDVYDRSDVFDMHALAASSLYWKRSFHRPDIERLPDSLRSKVLPFGPNFACRGARDWHSIPPRPELAAGWENYRSGVTLEELEQTPAAAPEPAILLQTRVWSPGSTSDHVEEINESRVAVLRALRSAFPGRFYGGLVPNPHAERWYSDLISPYPNDPIPFAAFRQRHLIGVSTRGLHYSVPFKIPEYMAASMAIVSDPIRNEMAAPFVAGRHYLEFRTPDECVERCDRILSSPALACALREAGWGYYRSHVRPPARIADMLARLASLGD